MKIQMVFLGLFAINILLIWLSTLVKKVSWYRPVGGTFLHLIPLITVFFAQPRFELDFFWWKAAGVIAIILGIGIMVWSIREFEKQKADFRFAEKPEQFVNTGPYAFVRHAWYLGVIFVFVGWWWIWAAVYSFYFGMFILALIWLQAYLEEKFILEKQFGDQYRGYKQQTGMFWIK